MSNFKLFVGDNTNKARYVGSLLPDQTNNAGKYLTTDGTTAIWVTLPSSEAVTDLASNNIDVYNKEEVNNLISNKLKEYPKQYWVSGLIANSNNTFKGYGQATIVLYSSGLAQIDYEYIVTTVGTNDSLFNWGLNRDLFQLLNSNIPIITPSTGGHCYIYTNSGVLWSSEMVNITESVDNFWCISQVSDTLNNTLDKYPESTLSLDYKVSGTAYGTFTV